MEYSVGDYVLRDGRPFQIIDIMFKEAQMCAYWLLLDDRGGRLPVYAVKPIPLTYDLLQEIGGTILPHKTIHSPVSFDIGRSRVISVSSIGDPNEMCHLYEIDDKDPKNITDVKTLWNYDYDGYMYLHHLQQFLRLLGKKDITWKH